MVRYFIGSAAHKLDAKGRVSLPADYREVLKTQDSADVFVIVPAGAGVPFHLAFSRQGHERLIERIAGMTFANPAEKRETRRRFISEARPISVEEGGRFVLSKELREGLGLDKEVQFVGDGETFQIWQPSAHAKAEAAAAEAAAPAEIDFAGLV
ncbi:MAG: hypothetical protein AAFU49_04720 [Pseudomonadota bacterium]